MNEKRINITLWLIMLLGIAIAGFPRHGRVMGEVIFGGSDNNIIYEKVTDKGSDFVVIVRTIYPLNV